MDGATQLTLLNVPETFKPCSHCKRTERNSCPFRYMNCWFSTEASDVPADSIDQYDERWNET